MGGRYCHNRGGCKFYRVVGNRQFVHASERHGKNSKFRRERCCRARLYERLHKAPEDMRKVKAYAQMQTGEGAAVDSRNEMVSLARSFLTMISGLKRDADRKTQYVLQPMNSYHGSKENDFVTVF